MPDIYIHIGTHKTGTTTIQNALRELARKSPMEVGGVIGNTSTAKRFMRAKQYDKALVQRLQRELQNTTQHRKAAKQIVLSSEALSGLPTSGYQNSNVVYSMLRDATSSYNAKVIVYLRRQDSFVESLYTQMIHQGEAIEFETFLQQYDSPEALNYRRMLDELGSCFGDQNLIVKSYHEASKRGLLLDFGDVIKTPSLQQAERRDRNPSYSRHALEIAKRCNLSLNQDDKKQLRRVLQSVMAKQRKQPFCLLSDDERTGFLGRYRDGNVEVAKRYFNGNLERLFPSPSPSPSAFENDILAYDDVAKLVVALLHKRDRGILAGIRVAAAGYPRFTKLLRKVPGRR